MLMSCSNNHMPNQPCVPNNITYTKPETTGDTAMGKSMAVINMLLPANSNFAMAHAAATPNTVFNGTTIAAVSNVSLIAASVSSSVKELKYTVKPFEKAEDSTVINGAINNTAKNNKATLMKPQRIILSTAVLWPGRDASSASSC